MQSGGPKKRSAPREDGEEVTEGSSGHGHQLGDAPPQLVPEAQDETWQQHAGRATDPACGPTHAPDLELAINVLLVQGARGARCSGAPGARWRSG